MENLVALVSRFYVADVRNKKMFHHPSGISSRGFYLELRISARGIDECELVFAPAMTTDITGGRYQEVPDIFGETYGQFSNRIEYTISGRGNSLQVTGPLLNKEEYPAVFQVVENMHILLTTKAGLVFTKEKEGSLYARTKTSIN